MEGSSKEKKHVDDETYITGWRRRKYKNENGRNKLQQVNSFKYLRVQIQNNGKKKRK